MKKFLLPISALIYAASLSVGGWAAAPVAAVASSVCTDNLVTNGGFENGLSGWSLESGSAGTGANYAREGSKTGWVVSTGSGAGQLTQQVAVVGNRSHTISFYTASHDRYGATNKTVTVYVLNGSGQTIATPVAHVANHWVDSDGYVAGPHTFSFVTAANATSVKIVARDASTSRDYIKLDGFCLTAAPLASTPTPTPTRTPAPTSTPTRTPTATPPVSGGGTGSIGDWVFYDSQYDGQQNGGDWGLDGVTVDLYSVATGQLVATKITINGGQYGFTNVPVGQYYLKFTHPYPIVNDAWTLPNVGNDNTDSDAAVDSGITPNFTVVANVVNNTVDAGLVKLSSIGDFVWLDTNGDGMQSGGEPGIPGVTVTVYDVNGTPVKSAVTDGGGYYTLRGIRGGTYSLGFSVPAGYEFTNPNAGNSSLDSDANPATGRTGNFVMNFDQNDTTRDAGFKIAPTPTPGPSPTPTSVGPTATPTSGPSSTPTAGPSPTPTATSTAGPSPTPTSTSTAGPSPTPTSTSTAGPSPTPTATSTAGPSPTPTATSTAGPSPTPTPTQVTTGTPPPTGTPVGTPTSTPPPTGTPAPTGTPFPPLPACSPAPVTVCVVTGGDSDVNVQCEINKDDNRCLAKPGLVQPAPPNGVIRGPYPRAMVTLDNTFKWVNADAVRPAGAPPVSMSGEGAPAASQDLASNVDVDGEPMLKGLIRNAKVEIVATLLETGTPWFDEVAPAPQWRFSDHAWNETKRRFDAVQSGITVTFNYETSSWGLPKRGRRFDFAANQPGAAQDLPAYLAEVITPVGYKRHVTYETTKDISVTIGGVTQTKTTWGNFVDEGWRDIDLRVEVGAPHAYGAQAKSQSGGLFNGVVYWDTGEEIRVPVIEVQSVLRANCTFDGGCVAPQAEPDTLQPLPNVPLLP